MRREKPRRRRTINSFCTQVSTQNTRLITVFSNFFNHFDMEKPSCLIYHKNGLLTQQSKKPLFLCINLSVCHQDPFFPFFWTKNASNSKNWAKIVTWFQENLKNCNINMKSNWKQTKITVKNGQIATRFARTEKLKKEKRMHLCATKLHCLLTVPSSSKLITSPALRGFISLFQI